MTLDVTIITGMSGAGRSAAGDVLEDLGFFVIDNLPPALVIKVAELGRGSDGPQRFALVIDVRSGEFVNDLVAALSELELTGASTRVLFLDAADDVLVRRYEESRRKHPLAVDERVIEGIAAERALLEDLKGRADLVVDTTDLNVHELRDRLHELFDVDSGVGTLQTSIVSFGYKHGLPIDVDLVFDCRFLPNPHWVESLRALDGTDPRVRDYVLAQPETGPFLGELERLFALLLPGYAREGKSYLSIGIGCTGGRHRSVVIADELARVLERHGVSRASTIVTSTVVNRLPADGPAVVALGGGHGLATALRAVRRYAGSITAVVTVADDGGSSGRLRRDLGVPPPGDIRRCLVALAGVDSAWSAAFEHRFADGELEGHTLGNLVLVGLTETMGSFPDALDEAGRLLRTVGRVLPATLDPVVLKAELADARGQVVEGQVAVANSRGIRHVALVPADVAATPAAVEAIAAADQVVYAPGSLYTSVLPVLCVAGLRAAIGDTSAQVVQVANLRPQVPETAGMDAADLLEAVLAHGARVDRFLYDTGRGLPVDKGRVQALEVHPVGAAVARADGMVHDPERLASALHALL